MTEPLTPYERYGFAYDIDQWYDKCSGFTFRTCFLPISPDEARILCKQHEKLVMAKKLEQTPEEYQSFKGLEQKIQNILETEFYVEDDDSIAAFVRMSARSPKDAVLSSSEMSQHLKRKLYEQRSAYKYTQPSPVLIQNDEFIAFFDSQIESLKFETAQQVLDIHCTSVRVYEDLNHALTHKLDDWSMQFVFREWIYDRDLALEFRAFVHNRKLTGVSQYYDMLYFEKLQTNKLIYQQAILEFFDSVKDQLPWDDCVMDVLISEPEEYDSLTIEDLSIQVIEFNPFNRYTSAALFSWTLDRDQIMGRLPFTFLIRTEPIEIIRNASVNSYDDASAIENPETPISEARAMMQLSLLEVDPSVLDEYQDTLQIVEEFMEDDVQRINSNLRYALQKISKESLFADVPT